MAGAPWENDPVVSSVAAQSSPWENDPIAQAQVYQPADAARNSILGKTDTFMRGAADAMTFGTADEIAAALKSGSLFGANQGLWGDYNDELAKERAVDNADSKNRLGYRIGGEVAGAVTGGAGLAKDGLSLAARAIEGGAGLGKVAAMSGADGAIMGALSGFGSGEGVPDRLQKAGIGSTVGGVFGLGTPLVVAAASEAAPLAARLTPEWATNRALAKVLSRSGISVDDVSNALSRASADGQDMFTAADALGTAGQRALAPIARTPGDARQGVVDFLNDRQTGQGERLASYLAEGFGAPDTAAQREASLIAKRSQDAATNYAAARDSASFVDPTSAIQKADEFLSPGITGMMKPANNIAPDSIESAVARAKSYLTDGKSVLTDFNSALRSKQEIDAMIEGASPTVQRQLIPIRNALDDSLASASEPYAAARDAYRNSSKAIEAVSVGKSAARPSVRADDSIQQFGAMNPDQQAAFRAGYADPLIARIESASMSPTTNKARALITPKTGEEFPAFAVPGRADQMGDRIAREQRMFETAQAALGGSKTADNLADAADFSGLDAGVISKISKGQLLGALMDAGRKTVNEARGMPPTVQKRLAEALLQTDPAAAQAIFSGSAQQKTAADAFRARMIASLLASEGTAIGHLAP